MLSLARRLSFLAVVLLLAGCASIRDTNVHLRGLAPEPMSERRWAQAKGVWTGPMRAEVDTFFGTKGAAVSNARLELYGPAAAPEAYLAWNTVYTSALASVGMRREIYTNIPERRYGTKGRIRPSTHAPDRLLLKVHPNVLSPTAFTYLLLTFRADGYAEVDYLGHHGWRGMGRWERIPSLAR